MIATTTFLLVIASMASAATLRGLKTTPQPVDNFELDKYLGRWFQVAASKFTEFAFEQPNTACIIADYGLNPNNTVSVHNWSVKEGNFSAVEEIYGWAAPADPNGKPSDLLVHLQGTPAPGPYWVTMLGPATFGPEQLYEYAAVTGPNFVELFVLARNVTDFQHNHQAAVFEQLEAEGYNQWYSKPLVTPQPSFCPYPPAPASLPL